MGDSRITIPIAVHKGWGRQGEYSVSVGPISGRGRTLSEAKQALADNILTALTGAAVGPAFARDDDGGLIVAVQGLVGGVTHWKVDDRGPRAITGCDGPPRKSLEGCHHYTVLGDPS
jgi:hypothetical protein